MANDSQRGYLSGIVQRGARIVSPYAPAAQVRPFESALAPAIAPAFSPSIAIPSTVPTIAPALDPPVPISSDLPNEVETFIEEDPAEQQPNVTAPLPVEASETKATSITPPAEPPEKLELAAPANPQKLDPALTERNEWGERLPRLIRVSTEKLSRDSNHQASTATEQIAAIDSSPKQNIQPVLTVEALTPQAESIAYGADSLVQRIEKSDAEFASPLPRNDQTFAERRSQFQQATPYTSMPLTSEPLTGVDHQPPDPPAPRETIIETEREVVVVQALPEQSETFVTWNPPPVQRDEFSMARPPLPSPRQESPKLTINRLDVQIVNQSVPPMAPPPPLPAPAPQPDGGNNLERYHLGHLDLIL